MKNFDDIAAELQGYDPQALSVDAAQAFLARLIEPVTQTESVNIFQALGRVLAQDVVAPVHVPPHDNSAMDGYAFAGAQLAPCLAKQSAIELKVVGTALAGKAWRGHVNAGECLKIMTGAVLPPGLDTVVAQELVVPTKIGGASHVRFSPDIVQLGDNRRLMGEDIRLGQAALHKGERVTPAAMGLAASLGIEQVQVHRRLRVAYFSTGDEILSLGQAPREGAVYDSNRYTVFGMLARLGVDMLDLGVVRDEPGLLAKAFQTAAQQADAIITSGGVSVGEADHTKAMMKKLAYGDSNAAAPDGVNAGGAHSGGGVAFWRIAMRPGRPMAVGRLLKGKSEENPHRMGIARNTNDSKPSRNQIETEADGAPAANQFAILFGLPGNPVAVMVTFLAFVRPALLQMMGSLERAAPMLQAVSLQAIRKKPGRTEYQRGIVSGAAGGHRQVTLTGNQGSGVLSSMVQANGLIVLHHDQGNVAPGDLVDVMMFDGAC